MEAKEVHAWLSRNGRRRTVEGMARFGIQARQAYGVTMAQLLGLKRRIGKDHALALALWDSGWYEARLLAALVGEPERLTRRQMNAWAAGFENWADCDTACFHLFDK
ncbi:MAG: DNA alkylation repair protein, partial [Xanthomonadales bacterium]|nr:DNA alkylation repair protein [Xanthomonadales bacterium]